MASLFRPVITRWVDADGKRCKSKAPGAKCLKTRAKKWYGKGIPGQSRPVPLATDRGAAQRMLNDMIRDYERGAAGIVAVDVRERTLADWIPLYCAEIQADGACVKHSQRKRFHLTTMVEAMQWKHPREMQAGPLKIWLAKMVNDGAAPQTRNHYLSGMREFAWWLIRRQALLTNPFREIRLLNAEIDQRHARRALEITELGRLLTVALNSERTVYRLDGSARHHLYLLACSTGFRAGELHSLTPAHFRLDGAPLLLLPARTDKAGRPVTQPLPLDVAETFRAWLDGRARTGQLWPGSWPANAAFMLRHDLAVAEIPPVIDSPETGPLHVDFHALRHTYVSLLDVAGVSLKEAMELARHRNPALTLKRYGRARLSQLSQSVAALPVPVVAPGVAPPAASEGVNRSVREQRREEAKEVKRPRKQAS